MGYDLSKPKEYKAWKKENRERAARMADMPNYPGTNVPLWAVDPNTGEILYSEHEVNTILGANRPGGTGGSGEPTTPEWLNKPYFVGWPGAPNTDNYGRWIESPLTHQNWQDWYAPTAQIKDKDWATIANRLLPYMNEDDAAITARQLYIAGEGAGGVFGKYLTAGKIGSPVFGGQSREPAADWEAWAKQTTPQFPDKPWYQNWWGNRPFGSRVGEWEAWWRRRPPGNWRNWFK